MTDPNPAPTTLWPLVENDLPVVSDPNYCIEDAA